MGLFGPNIKKMKNSMDIKGLIEIFSQDDYDLMQKASEALAEIGVPAIPMLITKLENCAFMDVTEIDLTARTLGRIGSPAIEQLIDVLQNSTNNYARRGAAQALGLTGEKTAVNPLQKALKDPEREVRSAAIKALGQIGAPAVDALKKALDNKYFDVQVPAVEELGKIGGEEAFHTLIKLLGSGSGTIQSHACFSLWHIGDPRALPPLLALEKTSKDENVIKNAAETIKKLRSVDVLETCDFCHEQVFVRKPGVSISTPISDSFFDELKKAAKRKFVCPSCASVFCLECGNKKGKELGTGSTHCPKCETKVL